MTSACAWRTHPITAAPGRGQPHAEWVTVGVILQPSKHQVTTQCVSWMASVSMVRSSWPIFARAAAPSTWSAGGPPWSAFAGRAASLGAQISTQTRVATLPAGPAILATSLADPSLAPPGHELIQIAAACVPDERKTDAERRVHRLLDQSWPDWRAAVQWRRSSVRTHCTGAIDLPGTAWRDRPAVSRGVTLAVATDQSAAPGLLAETGIAAAQLAICHLTGTGENKQSAGLTGFGCVRASDAYRSSSTPG